MGFSPFSCTPSTGYVLEITLQPAVIYYKVRRTFEVFFAAMRSFYNAEQCFFAKASAVLHAAVHQRADSAEHFYRPAQRCIYRPFQGARTDKGIKRQKDFSYAKLQRLFTLTPQSCTIWISCSLIADQSGQTFVCASAPDAHGTSVCRT